MEKSSRTYLEIFLISLLIFSPKWLCSYFFSPNEELLIKTLFDIQDVHYFLNVISLSNFDLTPSFSELVEPKKIITFPFFSIVFHALFYKVIGYSSFIILEFIFIFFSAIILFKILQKFDLKNNYRLFVIAIYFSFPFILNILDIINLDHIPILQNLVIDFVGQRFPRPLVTNVFFLLGIYYLINFQTELIEKKIPKSMINISIILALQINSFFYFFLIQGLLAVILPIIHIRRDLLKFIFKYHMLILKSLFIVTIGLSLFLFQGSIGEVDYSKRISVILIDLRDKIFLIKYFFLILFRLEVILLIIVSAILFFLLKKINCKNREQIKLFIILILSSYLSVIFFIMFSSKVISLYQFVNIFLFSFIFFIFFSSVLIVNNLEFIRNLLTKYRFIIYLFIFTLGLIFNSSNFIKDGARHSYVKVDDSMKKLKIKDNDIYLFTNNLNVQVGWLFNGFKNIYLTNGFNNSLSDNQIENTFSKVLRTIFNDESKFKEIIEFKNPKDNYRNSIISFFLNYKYQANSLHIFNNKNDFSIEEQKKIKETSPLRSQMHIIPISEKKKLINKILSKKSEIDFKNLFIVIDKNNWPNNFDLKKSIKKNFKIVIDNKHYFVAKPNLM